VTLKLPHENISRRGEVSDRGWMSTPTAPERRISRARESQLLSKRGKESGESTNAWGAQKGEEVSAFELVKDDFQGPLPSVAPKKKPDLRIGKIHQLFIGQLAERLKNPL